MSYLLYFFGFLRLVTQNKVHLGLFDRMNINISYITRPNNVQANYIQCVNSACSMLLFNICDIAFLCSSKI